MGRHAGIYCAGSHVPPCQTEIRIQVVHDMAKASLIQILVAPHTHPERGNSSYYIPLVPDSTVVGLIVHIGHRRLVGRVLPSQSGIGAADGLDIQNYPGAVAVSLGQISRDTQLRVEVDFVFKLQSTPPDIGQTSDHHSYSFSLSGEVGLPAGVSTALRKPAMSIQTRLLAASPIIQVSATPAGTKTNNGVWGGLNWAGSGNSNPRVRTVSLEQQNSAHLGQGFTIQLTTSADVPLVKAMACIEEHPSRASQALMISLPPARNTPNSSSGREIIFLADRSGSMSGRAIEDLKSALDFCLGSLPSGSNFNIWSFGSRCNYTSLWETSRLALTGAVTEARQHVGLFDARLGGTSLYPPLLAISGTHQGSLSDIIILTDGHIHDFNKVRQHIRGERQASNNRRRFFTIGIGNDMQEDQINEIAQLGGGYAEHLKNVSSGGWEQRVVRLLHSAVQSEGAVYSFGLELDNGRQIETSSNDPLLGKLHQSPPDINTISPFMPARIYLLLDYGTDRSRMINVSKIVVWKKKGSAKEVVHRVTVSRFNRREALIHYFVARSSLSDMEGTSQVRAAEELAVQYDLASSRTEYVMVEEQRHGEHNHGDERSQWNKSHDHHSQNRSSMPVRMTPNNPPASSALNDPSHAIAATVAATTPQAEAAKRLVGSLLHLFHADTGTFPRDPGQTRPAGGLLGPAFDGMVDLAVELGEDIGLDEKVPDLTAVVDALAISKALEHLPDSTPDLWREIHNKAQAFLQKATGASLWEVKVAGESNIRKRLLFDDDWKQLESKIEGLFRKATWSTGRMGTLCPELPRDGPRGTE